MSTNIYQKVYDLSQSYGEDSRTLADEVGVSYEWIRKFMTGQIKDPSVNRIEKLYTVLYKRKHGIEPSVIEIK
tara:strand:- start:908 stop:1126 length:219 start_codon:yes stop_codon:yes gene_type:complete